MGGRVDERAVRGLQVRVRALDRRDEERRRGAHGVGAAVHRADVALDLLHVLQVHVGVVREQEGGAVGAIDLAPVLVVAVALLDVRLVGGLRVPVDEVSLGRVDREQRLAEGHVAAAVGEGAPLLAARAVGREPVVEARREDRASPGAPVRDVPQPVGVEEVVERDDLVHRREVVVEPPVEGEVEEALRGLRLVLPVGGLVGEGARRGGAEVEFGHEAVEVRRIAVAHAEDVELDRPVVERGAARRVRRRLGGVLAGVVEYLDPPVHRLIRPVEEEGVGRARGLWLGEGRRLERLDVQRRVVDLARRRRPRETVRLPDEHPRHAGDHHAARLHRARADVHLPVDVRVVEALLRTAPEKGVPALAARGRDDPRVRAPADERAEATLELPGLALEPLRGRESPADGPRIEPAHEVVLRGPRVRGSGERARRREEQPERRGEPRRRRRERRPVRDRHGRVSAVHRIDRPGLRDGRRRLRVGEPAHVLEDIAGGLRGRPAGRWSGRGEERRQVVEQGGLAELAAAAAAEAAGEQDGDGGDVGRPPGVRLVDLPAADGHDRVAHAARDLPVPLHADHGRQEEELVRDVGERRVRVDLLDPGVDAVDEPLDEGLQLTGERRVEELPLLLGIELPARVFVVGEEVPPGDFREVAGRTLAHELHLEEAVLCLRDAGPVAHVVERMGAEVRDAEVVARQADVRAPRLDDAALRRPGGIGGAEGASRRRGDHGEREQGGEMACHRDIEPPSPSDRQAEKWTPAAWLGRQRLQHIR